jgi:hypothetical protein
MARCAVPRRSWPRGFTSAHVVMPGPPRWPMVVKPSRRRAFRAPSRSSWRRHDLAASGPSVGAHAVLPPGCGVGVGIQLVQAHPSALIARVLLSWSSVLVRFALRPSVSTHWISFPIGVVGCPWSQAHPSALIRVLLSARGSAGDAGCYRFRPIRRRSLTPASSRVRLGGWSVRFRPIRRRSSLGPPFVVTVRSPGRLTPVRAPLTSGFSLANRDRDASTGPNTATHDASFRPRVCEIKVN